MQLAAQYDSLDMQQVRARLVEKLLADPNTVAVDDTLLVFYENIAILHRRKLLDSELMYNTFSYDVRTYWLVLQPYILNIRGTMADDDFFQEVQRLNDHFVQDARTRNANRQTLLLKTQENSLLGRRAAQRYQQRNNSLDASGGSVFHTMNIVVKVA